MYDLHTHSIWSDGELIPAELVQRARNKGYKGIAVTDHADASNLKSIVGNLVEFQHSITKGWKDIKVVAGVELTHNPPRQLPGLIKQARKLGASVVVVHGESPVEPVPKGTNHAAIVGGADVLAHPGLITEADVKLAVKRGVLIEITQRKGHNMANGYVARLVKKFRAGFVFNTDSHSAADLFTPEILFNTAVGAGFSQVELRAGQQRAKKLIEQGAKLCVG